MSYASRLMSETVTDESPLELRAVAADVVFNQLRMDEIDDAIEKAHELDLLDDDSWPLQLLQEGWAPEGGW